MAKRLGRRTIAFDRPVYISAHAAIVGQKEGEGPLQGTFDKVSGDAHFGQKTWELAEAAMQRDAIQTAAAKAGLELADLDLILAGDLLNQCIGSSLASVQSSVPFVGLYSACSTMAEGLAVGGCLIDGGAAHTLCAAASSHFCAAERQYRFPLAYGGQRTPTAQWTATASGAAILTGKKTPVRVTHAVFGQMVDLDVTDANNMGAAMAPAAYDTLAHLFADTCTGPADYDRILTGDLARVGSEILRGLFARDQTDLGDGYADCGMLLYDSEQDVHTGGSGCGCSAAVLCGDILDRMERGALGRVIFAGTGALMSPTSVQQGQGIAGICHAVILEGA